MKAILRKNKLSLTVVLLFTVFTVVSVYIGFKPGVIIFKKHFFSFLMEMLLFLPIMFILIGLGDVWISREKVEKHIGSDSGFKGILLVIFLSMAQVGPLYGAFPVTYLLWKKGAGIRNIFIYIGAFCTIKIPMLTFEIGFLGWKFSLLRTLFSLPFIILIAVIMERILKNKNFRMQQP
ncbi:MAG: permease [Bacteroidales bacterium]|nr:permease [Bacteroidales bacterium]